MASHARSLMRVTLGWFAIVYIAFPSKSSADGARVSQASPAAPSTANPVAGKPAGDDVRTMRGHTFPRPVSDDSAFLPTTIGFRQGLLYIDSGDLQLLGAKRPVVRAAALESIDLSVNVVDWFAIGCTGDLQAQLAASEAALASTPSYVAGGIRFGPSFRAIRIASTGTQITFRPYFQASFGALVDVAGVITRLEDRLVSEVQTPPGTVSESISRARRLQSQVLQAAVSPLARKAWGGSMHMAQTITPEFGIQLSYGLKRERFVATPFDLNRGQLPDEYFVSLTHVATATLSFDATRLKVPLAILGEFVVSGGALRAEATSKSQSLDTTVLTGVGLYYAGRRSLQVGIHGAKEHGLSPMVTPFGVTGTPEAYYGQFSLRYFFESDS